MPSGLGSELRSLLSLAPPVILSQFAGNALLMIGTAVVGRLGTGALASVAFAGATYALFLMFLMGTMLSVGPRAAQAHGAGDRAGAALTLRAGLLLASGLCLLGLPLMWLLAAWLPHLLPADLNAAQVATYLRLQALSMWPFLLVMAARGTLESTGRAKTVTLVALVGVGSMLLLGPALTFGFGPVPRLEVRGAALANVLVSTVIAGILVPLALKHAPGKPTWPDMTRELRSLFHLGWPIGLAIGAEGGMFNVTALLMGHFGPVALAGHNVALQIINALFMVPLGLASATSIRVGQARGAGDMAGARRAGLTGLALATLVMLCFAALELLAPRVLIGVFVEVGQAANAELVSLATTLLSIAALFAVLDGLQVTSNAALRGLQDTRVPLIVSLAAYWVVGLGLGVALAFPLGFGPRGLWLGLAAGLLVAAAALLGRFLHKTRPGTA